MRVTKMEVDLKKFESNMKKIQKYVGNKKMMPVLKANGYGTYVNKSLDVVNKFDIIAVAILDEAIAFRKLGYQKEIFILNQPYIEDIDDILKYNIKIGISSKEFIEEIIKRNIKVDVHLEIETGMNRTGINLDDLDEIINLIKDSNINVEGVYTHLSSADNDRDYTLKQLEKFKLGASKVKESFPNIKYIHAEASNGILNYNVDFLNLVRPGIIMYGYESFEGAKDIIDVEPICKLKTKITFLKEVEENESISYSRRYTTDKKTKVATIPIGYADGLSRLLSNKGKVCVNGHLAPIIGSVCMDSCMIDVTGIDDVSVGTDVYIWDNEHVFLEDIATICETINYEILSGISSRVPREFKIK